MLFLSFFVLILGYFLEPRTWPQGWSEQGRPIQIWLGGLAPGFSNYWGGGKIAPQISKIGVGQDFENPNISNA